MQLITTSDGSHTLFSEEYNEIYHSQHGALAESLHVYIQTGFSYYINERETPFLQGSGSPVSGVRGCVEEAKKEISLSRNPLRIFEMGFGTGLNALLTLTEAQKHNLKVYYEAVELFPITIETVKELNYPAIIENEKYRPPFHSMHLSNWGTENTITPDFTLKKVKTSLTEYSLSENSFNIIYYDAFAPDVQPELWTGDIMLKMYNALSPGGILVTYCSKSAFQRALKFAGFTVQKLPGQKGKREIVRAIKND